MRILQIWQDYYYSWVGELFRAGPVNKIKFVKEL